MAEFVVTDTLKKLIGVAEPPLMYRVEEGAIQRYAKSVGDTNPLYNDIEYAAQSEFGRLMAPPGFAGWPLTKGADIFGMLEKLGAAGAPKGNLDGGVEFEFLAPIGAGDTLASVMKIANIAGRETKMGPTMVTTIETTYTNQRGMVAMIVRSTILHF